MLMLCSILDANGWADFLAEHFQIESGLAELLAERGFYVAAASTSNYNSIRRSLPSALNFKYLYTAMVSRISKEKLKSNTCDSAVRQRLRTCGYRFASCSSGTYLSEG